MTFTFSAWLHARRRVDGVAEETITRHFVSDHSSDTRAWHQRTEMRSRIDGTTLKKSDTMEINEIKKLEKKLLFK